MEEARDELLAGAALAADEDVDRARRDPLGALEGGPHDRSVGDNAPPLDLGDQLALEGAVLFLKDLAFLRQLLHLPRVLQRHAGESGHRFEEPALLFGERWLPRGARLLVEHREEPEGLPAVGNAGGKQLPEVTAG